MKTKKLQKKIRSLNAKLQKTNKEVQTYLQTIIKNYKSMKSKLKKIWLAVTILIVAISTQSCNVTRIMTTKSEYFQKGDTAVSIMTKTTETYNAEKH